MSQEIIKVTNSIIITAHWLQSRKRIDFSTAKFYNMLKKLTLIEKTNSNYFINL